MSFDQGFIQVIWLNDCGEGWTYGSDGVSNSDKKKTEFSVKHTACS